MTTTAQILASLNVSDKELVALLDKQFATADRVVKLADPVRLAVVAPAPGFPLQVKFIPGPAGRSEGPASKWGGGGFQSEKEAPPLGTYKLLIQGDEARLFRGELEVWSGTGEQVGVDGEYNIILDQPTCQ